MWWFLTREVLRLRGVISRELPWEVMPDLFFYRDPEEAEKEEQAAKQEALANQTVTVGAPKVEEPWGGDDMTTDWANEPAPGAGLGAPAPAAAPKFIKDDWATPAPVVSDWAADAPAGAEQPTNQWGGGSAANWN